MTIDPYLEAEYNNRTKIAGFAAVAASWPPLAAAFRDAHPDAEYGLAYGPTGRQSLDLFWPASGRAAPVAMFIHGGYWQALDRSMFSHMAAGLVAHGVAVAVPSYDLCPAVTLAELVEELRGCARFLAARHGRVALACGHSAGGHLAAMLLASGDTAAALPISGLFDLAPLLPTTVIAALRLDRAEARRLSPTFLPSPGRPLHAVVGGDEGREYESQSRSIAEAWGGTWESVPGRNHMTVIEALADPDSALVRRARAMAN